ncbi:MAG: capsular polysaccharide export protein, LipB/KpsS family [Planctomycetota bacterium]
MGLILFAAPGIEQFHLHEQLGRRLVQGEHRLLLLAADPKNHVFYQAQGMPSRLLKPQRQCSHPRIPLEEFALLDCKLAGLANPSLSQLRQARTRLERMVDPILRFFEVELPDLVLIHQNRSGIHRLVHFIAREFGSQVLHTGAGLIDGTMQWNEEGIDGDSSACRRTARDYRAQRGDEAFLAAAMAAILGEAQAPPLARRRVHSPDLWDRALLATRYMLLGQVASARDSLSGWREALATYRHRQDPPVDLPEPPFFLLMLQDPNSPRMLLDTAEPPSHELFIRKASAALDEQSIDARLLVLPPACGLKTSARQLITQLEDRVELLHPSHSNLAIAMSSGVITVNHPMGLVAMLADTPLIHLGRSPYEVRGLSERGLLDDLPAAINRALALENPSLRCRFLTRMLAFDHVWCDPDFPDTNGMRGLLQEIEKRLNQIQIKPKKLVTYRAGPVWPLATTTPPGSE